MKSIRALIALTLAVGVVLALVGCDGSNETDTQKSSTNGGSTELSGVVRLDGSSTVFLISEAMAEEFGREHRKVRVTVGVSGTGGGLRKFYAGDTDINDASRPIKDKEIARAQENGIEYIE